MNKYFTLLLTFTLNLRTEPLHGAIVEEAFGGREALCEEPLVAGVLQRVVHLEPREGLHSVVSGVGYEGRVSAVNCTRGKKILIYNIPIGETKASAKY